VSQAEARLTPGLWPSVVKLLHLRWMIFWRSFRRSRLRAKIGMGLLALAIVAIIGVIFFSTWQLLKFLDAPELAQFTGNISGLIAAIPNLILGATFFGVFLISFGVLLQALYLSGDMDFLLATPVPIRAVFVAKLLQAVLPNFALVCLFGLPVLFGLGISAGYTLLYYPAVILLLGMLALAAAGLAALIVMSIVRIFPARRVAEVLGFLGAISTFVCSQSGQLARYTNLSADQASAALGMLERFNQPWSPLAWASQGIVYLGKGSWLIGMSLVALVLSLSASVFVVSLVASERLYYSGWASMQNQGRKRKPPRSEAARPAVQKATNPLKRLFPAPVWAMMIKDWMVLRRDLRNLSQLITPLIIGIVYAFMIFRGENRSAPVPSDAPLWMQSLFGNVQTYASVGLALFVGWMLLGRLAGMGFSQEGRSFWLLKSSPVSGGSMIVAKYLVAFLPTLALSWTYLLAIWLLQRSPLSVFLFALPAIALCIAGNTGLSLSFGISGARLDWEDPRQMQRTTSSCLSTLVSMIYLPVTLLFFFGPPIGMLAFGLPERLGQAIGLVLGGSFSLLCAVLPLWMVRSRLDQLGE
jgi:ABC-2 type transport system permease protein